MNLSKLLNPVVSARLNDFRRSNVTMKTSPSDLNHSPSVYKQPIFHKRKQSATRHQELDMSTQQIVVQLQRRVKELEHEITMKDKEITRLSTMNEYLLGQVKNRETMIHEERKFLQKFKDKYHRSLVSTETVILSPPSVDKMLSRRFTYRKSSQSDVQNISSQITLLGEENRINQTKDLAIIKECLIPMSVYDMKVEDDQVLDTFNRNPLNKYVNGLLSDEDKFIKILQQGGTQKLNSIFDNFLNIVSQGEQLMRGLLRYKSMIKAALTLVTTNSLDEAIETIIQQSVKCMNCDRASCFVLDEPNQQLWSRVAKGVNGVIRISVKQGVAGFVATSKKLLNIKDAYQDHRFNPAFDHQTNYKTTTILCLPIMRQESCLGVIQLINKLDGVFTQDDEHFGQILCDFLSVVLGRAINSESSLITVGKLRHCIKFGVMVKQNISAPLQEKLYLAEKTLKQIMNATIARVAQFENGRLKYAQENGQIRVSDDLHSILGLCVMNQTTLMIPSCTEHVNYSRTVDLQTTLPVVCVPIEDDNRNVVGAFQVPIVRGIQKLSNTMYTEFNTKCTKITEH